MAYCRMGWIAFVMIGAVGCQTNGPRLYPVTGQVTVNGQPIALIRVQFRHTDQSLPGNLKMPVGITDASGMFALSTFGDNDGAVEGEYVVTFEWLSSNDLGAWDKFGGRFANPNRSTFKIRIEPKRNTLAPFELTIPETDIVNQPTRK